jgi:small subunit ribosomal protein S11
MGKKRIIEKSEKELLEERETIEKGVKKDVKITGLKGGEGRIYISSSYNNTMITLTDAKGDVLAWVSAGSIGFKGTKKSTPFAASKVAESIALAIVKAGIDKVRVFVKGIGVGRDSALRSLAARGVNIISIKDITPIPHNGCRPPKPRRV